MGNLEMSTGDMREAMRLLTAVERTPDQERILGIIRERCAAVDARLRAQDIELAVPVAQALEELLEGSPSHSEGPGYTYALHELIAAHFSDPMEVGEWARQSWLWTVDAELAGQGVPAHLGISEILMSGPPVRLPHAGDTTPWMGTFPVDRAAAFVAAHEAVLDRVGPEVRDTAKAFVKGMRFEAEEWETATESDRTRDTILFWCR